VVRAVLAHGLAVRGLLRQSTATTNLDGLENVTLIRGDVRDPTAVNTVLDGARYVFHVAADYRLWVPDPDVMDATNIAGTELVLRCARKHGVERMVYTSSVATLKVTPTTQAATENDRLDPALAIGAYKRSKALAERVVERLAVEEGFPVVIVSPSTPIGPRDIRPTPTGRVIVQAARGKMPAYVDTGLNLVGVDDVARGHVLALQHGVAGERYILGGQNVSLVSLLSDIASLTGKARPVIRLPRWPLYPLALAAEGFAQLTRREPFVTRDALKMSANRMYFSSQKAIDELGYESAPYGVALRQALDWFREAGYLGPRR